MNWTDLSFTTPVAHSDTASAIAALVATEGIYIEDYSDLETEAPRIAHVDLLDEELLRKDRSQVIIHIYLSPAQNVEEARFFLEARLSAAGVPFTMDIATVAEEDWATAWKAHYHPIELSDRLIICPSWLSCEVKPGQQVLRLDPGMAFGTGTHETTRLCLGMVERCLRPGMRVLDIGCGSGVLSIAAKLLGAGETAGVDIDPVAVRVAAENAAENRVDVDYHVGDLSKGIEGTYDLVLANIVADVIIRLLPDLPKVMAEGGTFVASGIIDTRADELLRALEDHGFAVEDRLDEGGWLALRCRRRA